MLTRSGESGRNIQPPLRFPPYRFLGSCGSGDSAPRDPGLGLLSIIYKSGGEKPDGTSAEAKLAGGGCSSPAAAMATSNCGAWAKWRFTLH